MNEIKNTEIIKNNKEDIPEDLLFRKYMPIEILNLVTQIINELNEDIK